MKEGWGDGSCGLQTMPYHNSHFSRAEMYTVLVAGTHIPFLNSHTRQSFVNALGA